MIRSTPCPKCAGYTSARYCNGHQCSRAKCHPEHMVVTCMACGFTCSEAPLDARRSEPLPVRRGVGKLLFSGHGKARAGANWIRGRQESRTSL